MNLQEYKTSNRGKKVPAEIIERWNSRIIPPALHMLGRNGAIQYMSLYGKSMAAPKCILLALKAENENCTEMADEFWSRAFELQFGVRPTLMAEDGERQVKAAEKVAVAVTSTLPCHLQPRMVETMQPVDADKPREFYINSSEYLGMPKRDGNRLVIIGEGENIYYQSRSQKLRAMPDIHLDTALRLLLAKTGSFVLDGELVYYSHRFSEHRTGAQAAKVNIQEGKPEVLPKLRYCIFDCLMTKGNDITGQLKGSRWAEAFTLYMNIDTFYSDFFEVVPISFGTTEKRKLANDQQFMGREGEIWARDARYVGGKHGFDIVRTKYRIPFTGRITGLTPTTAAGRPFGAIQVSWNGKPVGNVGTGYTVADMWKIDRLFKEYPDCLELNFSTQGWTETGGIFLGVFEGFPE